MMHRPCLVVTVLLLMTAPAQAADGRVGIAAVVGERLVSTLDVTDRIDMIVRTAGLSDNAETRARLRPQVLRALIDEALQLDEAVLQGVEATPQDIERAIGSIEKRQNKPPGSLRSFLAAQGVPIASFEQQLRAQIVWTKTVLKVMRPRITVTETEVEAARRRRARGGVGQEVTIASLLLPVNLRSMRKASKSLPKNW